MIIQPTFIKKQTHRFWLLILTTLAFALRLYQLDAQSLWFDEIVTMAMAIPDWYQGFLVLLGQGIQLTPLFHVAIKLWLGVGNSEWILRFPALWFGVLTVPVMFQVGRLYFNQTVGLLAALIFAINPFQVWYAQELKLYTLLPLAAAGAMYAFRVLENTGGKRGVGLLILFNLLGYSAHYFAFLVPAIQFGYMLLTFRRNHILLKRWLVAQIIGVLPLVPWWWFIVQQQHFATGIGWIIKPHWYDPALTYWNFAFAYSGDAPLLIVIGLLVMVAGIILGVRRAWQRPATGLLLSLWLFFPPVVVYLMSFGRISFYVDRYFLVIAPALYLLVAAGLAGISRPWLRTGALLLFVAATGLGLWRVYFDAANFSKEDWRALARQIDAQAAPGDLVVTCTDGHRLAVEYYKPHHNLEPDNVIFASQLQQLAEQYRAVWVVNVHQPAGNHYLGKTLPPQLNRQTLPPETARWEAQQRGQIIEVAGLTAFRYNDYDKQHVPAVAGWHCEQ